VALYEVVLHFSDRDEIRLTDRNGYRTGETIPIAGRRFRVTRVEPAQALGVDGRFVLEPCDDPRSVAGTGVSSAEVRPTAP
jgi:hypothetical protein